MPEGRRQLGTHEAALEAMVLKSSGKNTKLGY